MGSGRLFGAVVGRRALLGVLVVCLASLAGAVLAQASSAAGTPMTVQVVLENPDYETLAVDPAGNAYGEGAVGRQRDLEVDRPRGELDAGEGVPVESASEVHHRALERHASRSRRHGQLSLFRSTDQGANWTRVLDLRRSRPSSTRP